MTMVKCFVILLLLVGFASCVKVKQNKCNNFDRSKCCLEPLLVNLDETEFAKDLKSAGMDIVYPKYMNIGHCQEGCNGSRNGIQKELLSHHGIGNDRLDGDSNCCVPTDYKDFRVLIFREDMNGKPLVEPRTIKGIMVSKCGYV